MMSFFRRILWWIFRAPIDGDRDVLICDRTFTAEEAAAFRAEWERQYKG